MKTGDSFNLNLLPSQAKFQAARMKLQKIIRQYMVISAISWVLVVIVTFILFFSNGIILNAEKKKYDEALNIFKGMSEEVVLSQQIKYRIKVLGQILKDRFEYSIAFEKVTSIFSEKAKLTKFDIDKEKRFKIIVSTADKDGVNYIEDKVFEVNKGEIEGIKNISISSVKYVAETRNWDIIMGVILK
ncbi:MAG: hypothetical protein WC503_05555 [Candidatus Shapirobacteria bacterium]